MYITEKKLVEGGAFIARKYFSCMNRKRWDAALAAAWDADRDAHKEKLLRKGLEILLGNEK